MTAIARHFVRPRLNALTMAAARAHRVCQREDSPQPFDDPRLATNDRPPLRRMVANLEEATIDRHIVSVHVEHDDVTGRDPHDGIPRAAAQRMRTRGTDTRPPLHLQPRGRDPIETFHALRLACPASPCRDWGHGACGRCCVRSPTLGEATDVTFRTSLDECEL